MSDRVAVFSHGQIEQVGSPAEIYEHPSTAFVAGFVGTSNLVEGEVARRITGSDSRFSIRPEKIHLISQQDPVDADYVLRGWPCARCDLPRPVHALPRGAAEGGDLVVVEQNLESTSMDVMRARGQPVRLVWKKEHVRYVGN